MDCELLIIGAGAAGLSAALGAWEAGCRSILIADRRSRPGGILEQCIHRGFGPDLTGPEYSARLLEAVRETGAQLRTETEVLSVSGNPATRKTRPNLKGGTPGMKPKHIVTRTARAFRSI